LKKALFVATVVKKHIVAFHIPYIEWLSNNGYEVHVAARNDYTTAELCQIPNCSKHYDINMSRSPFSQNNISVLKSLREIIDNNSYDLIHCHTPVGGVLTRLAAKKLRKKGSKVIYTAHGFHFYKGAPLKNWLLYYPVERYMSRYCDALITMNQEDYSIANRFKVNNLYLVNGVGVDLKKFENTNINVVNKKKDLGIPLESNIIISVGEINKNKNHEVIIKALSHIKSKKYFYLICGEGERKKYLEKLAEENDVANQVIFLGYRHDINELYKVADIFAFPSFREGLSISLIEAMASGLPIVCSNIRGNIDLVNNHEGGILHEPNDIKGFTSAILEISQNAEIASRMSNINKSNAEKYNISYVLEEVKNIYKNI